MILSERFLLNVTFKWIEMNELYCWVSKEGSNQLAQYERIFSIRSLLFLLLLFTINRLIALPLIERHFCLRPFVCLCTLSLSIIQTQIGWKTFLLTFKYLCYKYFLLFFHWILLKNRFFFHLFRTWGAYTFASLAHTKYTKGLSLLVLLLSPSDKLFIIQCWSNVCVWVWVWMQVEVALSS